MRPLTITIDMIGDGDPSHHADRAKGEVDVNVKAFGAVGNGTADDTGAIDRAFAYANAHGGRLIFPRGTYNVDSATLAGMDNAGFPVTADGVTIEGVPGLTTIQLTGDTTGVNLIYANNVNQLAIRGIRFVGIGDAVAKNQVLQFGNVGATADLRGLTVEECEFEDWRALGWLTVTVEDAEYDISELRFARLKFISVDGDMYSDGGAAIASDCIRIVSNGPPGYATDIAVEDCHFDCQYIKRAVAMLEGVTRAVVKDNYVYGSGLDHATDAVQSYGLMAYGAGVTDVIFRGNQVIDAWTCGIYCVQGQRIQIVENVVRGTADEDDDTLCVGGIAYGLCAQAVISGNIIDDCGIGMQIQPANMISEIVISDNALRACGDKGLNVRESALREHTGGVRISGCTVVDSNIRIYESTAQGKLSRIEVDGNRVERGCIWFMTDTYGSIIANNIVNAHDQTYGIRLGGPSAITIVNNRITGGGRNQSNFGLHMNTQGLPPSAIIGNIFHGWQNGIYAPYGCAEIRDNLMHDVAEAVNNAVAGDLGRDPPANIPNTITTYWRQGQFVQDFYPGASPNCDLGWVCHAPASGLGCTYAAAATTGDMQNGQTVVTDVADLSRCIPGAAITLANAAAGPANLDTVIISWKITYSGLTGTFEAGEYVEDDNGGLGVIQSDSGTVLEVVGIPYRAALFAAGGVLYGHASGATADIDSIGLEVEDACGNTVNDAALSWQTPTWTQISH